MLLLRYDHFTQSSIFWSIIDHFWSFLAHFKARKVLYMLMGKLVFQMDNIMTIFDTFCEGVESSTFERNDVGY